MTIEFSCVVEGEQKRWPRAFPQKEFVAIYRRILKVEKVKAKRLELRLSDSFESQRLNATFRKKAKPTDVLSFPSADPNVLGSVMIDLPVAEKQAVEFQHTLKRELQELFIHGVLHLLGYDHEHPKDAKLMAKREYYFRRLLESLPLRQ